ncbi:hypothetical protein OZ664_19820 [Elizabethkingia sp. HX WHF]|uniref:hypothetical protein n=1 Tax=Elizabethkingia TaxID=308865 RepID=UPI000CE97F35|nr:MULTISPECIES: hypothetical protein [Elizabethkingia]AVF49361.1 hypothetical protein AL491_15310 [Elizabethkingia anophelis]AVF53356.1 hypothetical protein AL492_17715 [Elizabethkingia anophelis]MDX8566266.1 hypothetical protein [Elizabethkingia sp. HX WHF]
MAATVLHNQSLLDIAIQATGKAENAILIAVANNISITDDLEPGTELIIPDVPMDLDVIAYYRAKNIQPATAIKTEEINYPEGINYWEIEKNFKIT